MTNWVVVGEREGVKTPLQKVNGNADTRTPIRSRADSLAQVQGIYILFITALCRKTDKF